MSKKQLRLVWTGFFWLAATVFIPSCMHDPFLDPNALNEGKPSTPGCTTGGQICFESSVLPIFISSCARPGCHDATTHEDGYLLDSYANIVRKGIKPGNPNDSKIYKVLFEDGEDRMPPDGDLTQAQKDSIKVWIQQGAKNTTNCACTCNEAEFTYAAYIKPILDKACVGCHKPGTLSASIDLSSYAAVQIQAANGNLLGTIKHSVGYVPMPQGTKLSDCEITKIENWIQAGAPNN
jgi:hypothetical protein